MITLQMPSTDHGQFDAICARVDDWDHLPAVKGDPTDPDRDTPEEAGEQDASLNGLILAGLVSPH
jgi:hypothetical protein